MVDLTIMHKPLRIVSGKFQRGDTDIEPGDLLALYSGSGRHWTPAQLEIPREGGSPCRMINASWLKPSIGAIYVPESYSIVGFFTFVATIMFPLEKKRDGTQRLVKTPIYFNDELGTIIVVGGADALVQIA